MYLSAERMAVANGAIQETFEQSSVAWQAIPHWDTGDPGQSKVRSDVIYPQPGAKPGAPLSGSPLGGPALDITVETVPFYVTLAQASAPTPDALLAALMSRTAELAGKFDDKVIGDLCGIAKPKEIAPTGIAAILGALIDARSSVENAGYRAPSCLFTSTGAVKAISPWWSGNARHRVAVRRGTHQFAAARPDSLTRQSRSCSMLGRRQRIAHGGAAEASPGEEPVDIAVSVPPSLEVVGETVDGNIELAVRIRFAPRIKDVRGVVAVVAP